MKNDRQSQILDIIAREQVETQEQLIDRLRERGIESTQATISRDIKQLHLIKEAMGGGRYCYAVSTRKMKLNFADRLQTILRESITGVDHAQNIVVLKTMPGLAAAAASAFDGMELPSLVGSVAGDDTALLIMRDNAAAETLRGEIAARAAIASFFIVSFPFLSNRLW